MWNTPEVSLHTFCFVCLGGDAELPDVLSQAVHLCFSDVTGLLQRETYPFTQVPCEPLCSQSYVFLG